jgi:5-methylcytosine-specific restriction protein B
LERRSDLLSLERLEASYNTFRIHFGPDVLRSLDGLALLTRMHAHGTKDSLVYWLEFKDDAEFPGYRLGSIAGGAAHKFGLFRRKGSEQWVTGAPQHEQNLSEADAVTLARQHRDQLLSGVELLEALPNRAGDSAYLALQHELEQQAPLISHLAWAHKYWSLLFPEKLDDFHKEQLQRYNLLRLLQMPPAQDGLYVCAGRFVELAEWLRWPLNHVTSALVERNHPPRGYWRLSARLMDGSSIWSAMRDSSCAAMALGNLGDLSAYIGQKQPKAGLDALLKERYPSDLRTRSLVAGQVHGFSTRMAINDIVLATDGAQVLAIGRVNGAYRYDQNEPASAPHRRDVTWLALDEWALSKPGSMQNAFARISDFGDIIQVERRLSKDGPPPPPPPPLGPLDGIPGRIQAILDRKGQAIVYGPPGTGKTFWARRAALDITAMAAFRRPFAGLSPDDKNAVEGANQLAGLVRWCTFHPAYGYEDFIEGFRPQQNATGELIFRRQDGIFKTLCADAARAPNRKFLLVVDEINRGDIPRIFGELLTLLEYDKRGMRVSLPLSGESFTVPPNVYLLGTMNTADRSIALLDTALRRRFGFVELMPDASILENASADAIPLGPWLVALNERLRAQLGRNARNLQIGHAYLLKDGEPISDFDQFTRILAEDLVPLLEEYCYDNYDALAQILGPGLVDEAGQRIREELFAPDKKAELLTALLSAAPDIATTLAAAEAVVTSSGDTEDMEDATA